MTDLTLESLAKRVAALEQALAGQNGATQHKDWRSTVGMFRNSEVLRQIEAEGRAIREAERVGLKLARIFRNSAGVTAASSSAASASCKSSIAAGISTPTCRKNSATSAKTPTSRPPPCSPISSAAACSTARSSSGAANSAAPSTARAR